VDYRYFVTIVFDGFETSADQTVISALFAFYARLPTRYCLLTLLFAPDDVRRFKTEQDLKGKVGPLIVITEKTPFAGAEIRPRAILEVGRLKEADDIKRVLATLAEQAHDEDFLKRARSEELLRRIQDSIRKFGGVISSSLSVIGLGA
jgi:hypothetical protein